MQPQLTSTQRWDASTEYAAMAGGDRGGAAMERGLLSVSSSCLVPAPSTRTACAVPGRAHAGGHEDEELHEQGTHQVAGQQRHQVRKDRRSPLARNTTADSSTSAGSSRTTAGQADIRVGMAVKAVK